MKKPTGSGGQSGNDPIVHKKQVPHSNDQRIDEDFPGFPQEASGQKDISHGGDSGREANLLHTKKKK